MAQAAGQAPGGARGLARRAMRAQVSAMAFNLFTEHGYEATTVEDICEVAGISRSTFFRYFPSKEAALFGEMADAGGELLDALRSRPDDESPWVALRRASDPLIERYLSEPEQALRVARLIAGTPALAAWHHEKNARAYELLRPELARRLGSDVADPRTAALTAAALGCVNAALTAWISGGERQQLGELLDLAMSALAPVSKGSRPSLPASCETPRA